MVNDGVVDSSKPKDQVVLHLASANQQSNKPRYQDRPKGEKCDFTQLGESYEEIFMKLLARNLVHPYDAAKFYIPEVMPWWWDEKAYCKLHNGIGHNIEKCGRFKHIVEESVNMMEDKDPNGYILNLSSPIPSKKPLLVLRGAHSRESSQGPLVIRGPNSN